MGLLSDLLGALAKCLCGGIQEEPRPPSGAASDVYVPPTVPHKPQTQQPAPVYPPTQPQPHYYQPPSQPPQEQAPYTGRHEQHEHAGKKHKKHHHPHEQGQELRVPACPCCARRVYECTVTFRSSHPRECDARALTSFLKRSGELDRLVDHHLYPRFQSQVRHRVQLH